MPIYHPIGGHIAVGCSTGLIGAALLGNAVSKALLEERRLISLQVVLVRIRGIGRVAVCNFFWSGKISNKNPETIGWV